MYRLDLFSIDILATRLAAATIIFLATKLVAATILVPLPVRLFFPPP